LRSSAASSSAAANRATTSSPVSLGCRHTGEQGGLPGLVVYGASEWSCV
jgi:hypothetical protein